jgi:HAD superfamily hydrolase (TIGR01662 family)
MVATASRDGTARLWDPRPQPDLRLLGRHSSRVASIAFSRSGRYVTSVDEFRFLDGAEDAIRRLKDAGLRVIVVTNQRGIARGLVAADVVDEMNRRLDVDAVYVCPHELDSCDCRKPGIGLFLQAKRDFPEIEFERSVVVGDSDVDVEAGRRIGARTIRIGEDVASLAEAVDLIVR